MVNVDEPKEYGAVEMIAELREEIETIRIQLADTQNRVEELEIEALPDNQKPYKSNSGGWSAW